ncbi:hypothetical protein PHJA_001412100 [Phtheirospermum japonicum]|uniref:Uncharacterized protein n=1 Tax=Phtheirospermum japonicum TaxID=374723 RepID=A0A830C101_9LAMI|nr:hypothetical protein PHJA_001412100 [Phtheirospermum japonicum]
MEPRSCGNSQGRPITRSKILKDIYKNEGANRTLWETKPKIDDGFIPRADDNPDSVLDDETTLKQLRKRFSTKKRERIRSDEKKPVDDESDLNEPLINLKPKRSKTSKSQRKRMNLSVVSSSSVDSANKSNESLFPEGSDPVIRVKVEIPDPEQSGYQNKTPAADEGLNPNGTATNEFQNMVLYENREPLICGQEYQDCVTNEILDDRVEDVEPISILVPSDGMRVNLEPLEIECQEFLDLTPLAIQKPNEDQNSNVCIYSRSSSTIEDISSSGNGPQKELNPVLFEDNTEADRPFELEDSLSSEDKNCDLSSDSIISLKIEENVVSKEETIADEEQHSTRLFEGHIEGELQKAEENQTSAVPITDEESQCSLENQTCDTAGIILTPEARLSPENLMSTRKVISPSSEERLCLAMNSVEIWNGADSNKCKGKLFEEQTAKKSSSLGSAVQNDKATVNNRRPDKVRQRKAIISPRHNINKSQISKGNLEGPRFSRTLPNLSTECASIQSCSESAVAFSKQQMHDMESLAVKLMNELKSMKDIVEQKLLFEAYRNVSLKNDADEVKSAINNASKVEETSRKWLSIMSRDCNRFCKIMKMTPNNSTSTSKDRETRKIIFADEAGGELCRVKFFEDDPLSDGVKQ